MLQQRQQVRFHKQADKINHEARVGRRSRNKSIIIDQINWKPQQNIESATIWNILAREKGEA